MLSNLGFFGIALVIGGIPLALKSHSRIRLYQRAQHWPKVRATVIKSSVTESTDGDGTSFRPEFSYCYSVAGIEYCSTEHTEGLPFPSTEEAARRMVNSLPVGSSVDVAVCPTEPKRAVLDTGCPRMWQILRRASMVALVAGAAIALHELVIPK
ncbi:DUF3592 domain-containing protein [Methyloversatilis sp. XJ19-49]|uniref:DUF3592 domain-containing protein n=1 Tax=Methyloversatilis sp. XJ19-49 TaxID=2963429 RepID=UPI00211CCCF9|nr:DUF3592 domain-containing protein [Methyloversatilis sp. XJ19-49]MCQ9377685.1 DUF3592 domain-containing protein [Methyloversatilis sp. XJ19-49]